MNLLVRVFRKLNPLEMPLAVIEEQKRQAESELEEQRERIRREEQARAAIERSVLAATRSVMRRRPKER